MNPYLTIKSKVSPGWYAPVFVLLGLLAAATAYVTVDFAVQGDGGTAAVGLLMLALVLWPVVAIARRWLYRARARRLANAFEQVAEQSISLDRLNRMAGMHGVERHLDRLIKKGYLQNVQLDRIQNKAVLTAANRFVAQAEYITMECPRCGANNRVWLGRINRCAYCDSELAVTADQQSGEGRL